MNILFLYNETQTFTNTVFEHLSSFKKYSKHRCFFVHHDQYSKSMIDYSLFDALIIHYTVRLPFNQISERNAVQLKKFKGLKALFIQDEYDYTHQTWKWIERLGIHLVFTVVPENAIANVYPPDRFANTRFVNVLTGYVPDELSPRNWRPPSKRKIIVGYRGRPLPIRYGLLGIEKVSIGKMVKQYCEDRGIAHDIAWSEEERIYGPQWYEFLCSCRATLGSESGSNVFDWEGELNSAIDKFRRRNHNATEDDIYTAVVSRHEVPGMMNQISPRVFEAAAFGTVLVLFEGSYSGIVKPYLHYIPLKKDGSNLGEVFSLLFDSDYVDKISERAHQDLIVSEKYSYQTFVALVDDEIEKGIANLKDKQIKDEQRKKNITISPVRSEAPKILIAVQNKKYMQLGGYNFRANLVNLWIKIPEPLRVLLRPVAKIIARSLIGK